MRNKILSLLCIAVCLGGACSIQTNTLDESKLVASAGAADDVMYEPVALSVAQKLIPFAFETPTRFPYKHKTDPQAVIRKISKEKKERFILSIKYAQAEETREYIELTVADFPYNMSLITEQKLFDEEVLLKNGTKAYIKKESIAMDTEGAISLTWHKKGLDYQLVYRYINGEAEDEARKALIAAADSM